MIPGLNTFDVASVVADALLQLAENRPPRSRDCRNSTVPEVLRLVKKRINDSEATESQRATALEFVEHLACAYTGDDLGGGRA